MEFLFTEREHAKKSSKILVLSKENVWFRSQTAEAEKRDENQWCEDSLLLIKMDAIYVLYFLPFRLHFGFFYGRGITISAEKANHL